jgi:hypothetical protein
MANIKPIANFYFHPVNVPTFLLLPIFITTLLYRLLQIVSSFYGYAFIFLIATLVIFFTIRIVKYLIYLITGRPALTLTERTLYDYQTGMTIEWTDINNFYLKGYLTTYISIKLVDPEKYISSFLNPLIKYGYRLNTKLFHGTFTFIITMLKGKNEMILETLENFLQAANNKIND